MTRRIFRAIVLVALSVLVASFVLILGVLYSHFSRSERDNLQAQTILIAEAVQTGGQAYLESLSEYAFRVTWIAADGSVQYDTETPATGMENHADREEIIEAMRDGVGESSRYSNTMLEKLVYVARRLPDGTVIRISTTQYTETAFLLMMMQPIAVVLVVAIALSFVLAARLSKRIVQPLNALDLDHPASNPEYDELQPMLQRLEQLYRRIGAQMRDLARKQREFQAITAGMQEGLVLLDEAGVILALNRSANQILNADAHCIGRKLLTLDCGTVLQPLVEGLENGHHREESCYLQERMYHVHASPIVADKQYEGAALLFIDQTEQWEAEQMRREFSANVSHELKTPLHSISGCAELLLHDMVLPADRISFTKQIYEEAQRMMQLVEDILRLSKLDEGDLSGQVERVDLFALAKKVQVDLTPIAKQAQVTLTVEGASASVDGIAPLLYGLLYNLTENAVKYNHPAGTVTVQVTSCADGAVCRVQDTGIGIAPAHQSRIFERFYRVDKSHSKSIGGTGLGLAIVKHAAQLHHAEIRVESKLGCGTTMTVQFPPPSQPSE